MASLSARRANGCTWSADFARAQEVIICTYPDPSREVTFAVCECSHFRSSITPTPQQMEDIALIIPTEPARKPAGFVGVGFGTSVEEAPEEAGLAEIKT